MKSLKVRYDFRQKADKISLFCSEWHNIVGTGSLLMDMIIDSLTGEVIRGKVLKGTVNERFLK